MNARHAAARLLRRFAARLDPAVDTQPFPAPPAAGGGRAFAAGGPIPAPPGPLNPYRCRAHGVRHCTAPGCRG